MFNFKRVNNSAVGAPSIKQLVANTAVSYAVGDALNIASGKAAKVTGTTKPTYICAQKGTGLNQVSAYLVDGNQEYEVELSAAGTSLKIGDKVTIDSDSAKVTATTTSGVAEIVSINGTAVGDTVVVKF